jgi:hypothetical protein
MSHGAHTGLAIPSAGSNSIGTQRRQHCAIANGQLVVDVVQMHLDGALAHAELPGDLLVSEASADQLGDSSVVMFGMFCKRCATREAAEPSS